MLRVERRLLLDLTMEDYEGTTRRKKMTAVDRLQAVKSLNSRTINTSDLNADYNDEKDVAAVSLIEHLLNSKVNPNEAKYNRTLPRHLEQFRRDYDRMNAKVQLPTLSQLSPRTKRKIASLPPPNEVEMEAVEKLEDDLRHAPIQRAYDKITDVADATLTKKHLQRGAMSFSAISDALGPMLEPGMTGKTFNDTFKSRLPTAMNPVSLDASSTAFLDRLKQDMERQQAMQRDMEYKHAELVAKNNHAVSGTGTGPAKNKKKPTVLTSLTSSSSATTTAPPGYNHHHSTPLTSMSAKPIMLFPNNAPSNESVSDSNIQSNPVTDLVPAVENKLKSPRKSPRPSPRQTAIQASRQAMIKETTHATAGTGSSSSSSGGQGQGKGTQGPTTNDTMMYFGSTTRGHLTGSSLIDTGPKTPAEFLIQYNMNKKSTRAVYLGDEAAAAEEENESHFVRSATAHTGSKSVHTAGVPVKKKRAVSPSTSQEHIKELLTHTKESVPATVTIDQELGDDKNLPTLPSHTAVEVDQIPTVLSNRPDSRGKVVDSKSRPDSKSSRPSSASSSSHGLHRDAPSTRARSTSPSPLDSHHQPHHPTHRGSSPQPTILELEPRRQGLASGQVVSEYQQYHLDQHNKFKEDLCVTVEKELGLVLDAKLHARNARKQAFQTMVYYVAKHRKKHAFRHFKIQYGKWTAAIRDRSARLLQRVARGFFARTRARLKRRNRQLQIQAQLDREHRARALVRYQYCAKAMCYIQETRRIIRGHYLRKCHAR